MSSHLRTFIFCIKLVLPLAAKLGWGKSVELLHCKANIIFDTQLRILMNGTARLEPTIPRLNLRYIPKDK